MDESFYFLNNNNGNGNSFFLIKLEREKVIRAELLIAAKPVPVETTSPAAKHRESSLPKLSHRLLLFLLSLG